MEEKVVFICSKEFANNYRTVLKESDTCDAVIEDRLKAFLESQGFYFNCNFRWISKTFSKNLPKKYKNKPIIDF